MDIQQLKALATQDLAKPNYPAKKMVLIHTAVSLAISLVLSLISFLLGKYADSADGIGALGMQTAVSAVQLFLPFLSLAFSPFWTVGLENVALGYAEGIEVEPQDLLAGFRRWRPVLTSSLMLGVQYLLRAFVASFAAGQLLMYTPFGYPLYQATMQQLTNPNFDLEAALEPHMPMLTAGTLILTLAGFIVLALPLYYRYRMTNYEILQNPDVTGMQALMRSSQLTYRKRKALFKLDMHFWWFFGLNLLVQIIGYGDLLLELAGVTLPISADAASWLFLLVAMVLQTVLFVLVRPKYEVIWARAYFSLCPDTPEGE